MSLILAFFLVLVYADLSSQTLSNIREKTIFLTTDTIRFDTLSILPDEFVINKSDKIVSPSNYTLLWSESKLVWHTDFPPDSITLKYRVFNIDFHQTIRNKDPNIIIPSYEENRRPYIYSPYIVNTDDIYTSNLEKSGSIIRGISLGNNQDLSVTSGLDLRLNGNLNDKIKVLASVTDNNIPIQPDGNTQQLQDFDKVFIQLYTDKSKLIAGDFDAVKPYGYFMKYNKKGQGLSFETGGKTKKNQLIENGYRVNASAAISKGKYARNTINALEGNQGPYKLRGRENEPFIIVLSGSEKIYIDGKLMQRGADNDYIINYNSAELTFTTNRPITKDKRITVEYQYSDKNYVRSLLTAGFSQKKEKINWYIQAYGEQDSKGQPLQQDLTDEDKFSLSTAGDDFLSAFVYGADSVGYSNNFVLYSSIDSLGYDSIFVYSTNPDSAHYRVVFSQVGLGNGDYVESGFSAGGKIYKWIKPELVDGFLLHQGNYAPLRLLQAPVKHQMVTAGATIDLLKNMLFSLEGALSNVDGNTFSSIDDQDNVGFGIKTILSGKHTVFEPKKGWNLKGKIRYEKTDEKFEAVERFRGVEFTRDWNLGQRSFQETELSSFSLSLNQAEKGKIYFDITQLVLPSNLINESRYQGQKGTIGANLKGKKVGLITDNSILLSKEKIATYFFRHKSDIYTNLGKIKLGIRDEIEDNQFTKNDSLFFNSHQFYFGEVYLQSTDSLKNSFRFFYNQRLDKNSDLIAFRNTALAEQYGGSLTLKKNPRNFAKITLSNRSLKILNTTLIDAKPEETILGRLNHTFKTKKSTVILNSYYEVTSGLEAKQEFIYIEVPAGQGVYVWNDYNNDQIKDLNEFEIAAFDYEANYLRSFIPSDEYQKIYGNSYSQTLQLNSKKEWAKKSGFLKLVSHFSSMTNYKTERKTSFEETGDRFNPFTDNIADTALVALNKSLRNVIYFNRTHPVFSLNYTFMENKNKSILTNGFNARAIQLNEIHLRVNLDKGFTLTWMNKKEDKSNLSDFLSDRNYKIISYETKPELLWQPKPQNSIKLIGRYTTKSNVATENVDRSNIFDLGIEGRINSIGKGTFQVNFNWIDISYTASENNNLAFEMLEGLHRGTNYTWGINFQQKISKNIQIDLNYQGRKSEVNPIIHAGGMSARAFF